MHFKKITEHINRSHSDPGLKELKKDYFHTLCGTSKGFFEGRKSLHTTFEEPQRSVKISVNFYLKSF